MVSVKERIKIIDEKLWRIDPRFRLLKSGQCYQVIKYIDERGSFVDVSPVLTLKEMELWVSAYMRGWAEAWRTAKRLLEENKKEEFKWMIQNQGLR